MEAPETGNALFSNVPNDKILEAWPHLNRWGCGTADPIRSDASLAMQLVAAGAKSGVCCKSATEYELALASWVRCCNNVQHAAT
jgi:hypothetical protein